jgi:hypothetical protein
MARRVTRAARRVGAVFLPFALSSAFGAATPISAQVAFAPPAEAKFQRYGTNEELILQGRILDAVTKACEAHLPVGVSINVLVEDVAPTYPTREQLSANQTLDPVKTRYLGGAALSGNLLGDHGEVLTTVRHRYYPSSIEWRSRQYDPWSDANRAIAQFADQLGAACRAIAQSVAVNG